MSDKTNDPKPPSEPASQAPVAAVEDDSDPGYEDLDDILDQFNPSASKSAKSTAAPQQSSATHDVAAPSTSTAPSTSRPSIPPSSDSEADFLAQLQSELSKTLTDLNIAPEGGQDAQNQAKEITDMGKELDEFTRKMEQEGLKPEDLLKAILGEEGIDPSQLKPGRAGTTIQAAPEASKVGVESTKGGEKGEKASSAPTSFEETIRATMERMAASDTQARDAQHSSTDKEEDILAQLMKAMESSSDPDNPTDDSDLSNLFLNMMQQLTSKELLYEPMKELDSKFPEWLEKNKGKLKKEDEERYETQQLVVKEIVGKFEEPTYSDDNEKDRAFVWEKMQQMQSAGSPPEDLITAPFPGAFGPGSGGEGLEMPPGGCPTQ